MDSSETLSNEEVDAILDISEEGQADSPSDHSDAELIDFGNSENYLLNFPKLKAISELLRSELRNTFSQLLRHRVLLSPPELSVKNYAVYLKAQPSVIYTLVELTSHKRIALINIDKKLLHHQMTVMFGGNINPEEPIHETLGNVDERIMAHLGNEIMHAINVAWKGICEFQHQINKTTTLPQILTRISSQEMFLIIKYTMKFDEVEGDIEICLQRDMLDELKPLLSPSQAIDKQLPQLEATGWNQDLRAQVYDSNLDLIAMFPEVTLTFKELTELKPGDIIPISNPEAVQIQSGDVTLYKAQVGVANGNKVIKITDAFKD